MSSTTDIEAKISHLRKLPAIRERCARVFAKAREHQLGYFVYHPEREVDVVDFCAGIITVRLANGSIVDRLFEVI